MQAMRPALKRLIEQLLLEAGPAALGRMRVRGRTLVVAYHNILPDGAESVGERALHLPLAAFLEQLDLFAREAQVVPLQDIGDQPGQSRPQVVITFDDAYQGAVTAGAAALVERGFPATIFVAPAFIGGRSFWWDALAEMHGGALAASVRAQALNQLAGDDAAIRSYYSVTDVVDRRIPRHARAADEQELKAAAAQLGIQLASHTWSHLNLCALDVGRLKEELSRPILWLRDRFPSASAALSYPYGLNDAAVRAAVRDAGYERAMRVDGGWLPADHSDPYTIPRLNIPAGMSTAGVRLRLAGLLSA